MARFEPKNQSIFHLKMAELLGEWPKTTKEHNNWNEFEDWFIRFSWVTSQALYTTYYNSHYEGYEQDMSQATADTKLDVNPFNTTFRGLITAITNIPNWYTPHVNSDQNAAPTYGTNNAVPAPGQPINITEDENVRNFMQLQHPATLPTVSAGDLLNQIPVEPSDVEVGENNKIEELTKLVAETKSQLEAYLQMNTVQKVIELTTSLENLKVQVKQNLADTQVEVRGLKDNLKVLTAKMDNNSKELVHMAESTENIRNDLKKENPVVDINEEIENLKKELNNKLSMQNVEISDIHQKISGISIARDDHITVNTDKEFSDSDGESTHNLQVVTTTPPTPTVSQVYPFNHDPSVREWAENRRQILDEDLGQLKDSIMDCAGPAVIELLMTIERLFDVNKVKHCKFLRNILLPLVEEQPRGRIEQNADCLRLCMLANDIFNIMLNPADLNLTSLLTKITKMANATLDVLGPESYTLSGLKDLQAVALETGCTNEKILEQLWKFIPKYAKKDEAFSGPIKRSFKIFLKRPDYTKFGGSSRIEDWLKAPLRDTQNRLFVDLNCTTAPLAGATMALRFPLTTNRESTTPSRASTTSSGKRCRVEEKTPDRYGNSSRKNQNLPD